MEKELLELTMEYAAARAAEASGATDIDHRGVMEIAADYGAALREFISAAP